MNSNTKLFIDTIDSLASSQGHYSRMSRDIHYAIVNNPSIIEYLNETLPTFKDSLDVIMFLEEEEE